MGSPVREVLHGTVQLCIFHRNDYFVYHKLVRQLRAGGHKKLGFMRANLAYLSSV